jgi:hypothetical protein
VNDNYGGHSVSRQVQDEYFVHVERRDDLWYETQNHN